MNVIIKIVQMTVVFITMNGTASVARPTNDIDNRTFNTGTASCKIAAGQNACYKFMFDPSIKLLTNTDTSGINQIAVNLKPENKSESITFTVIEHHGGAFQTHGTLENIGVKSASVGLSRVGHNETLKVVDGETSNEHVQANLLIQFEAMPTIEKYVHFFTSTGKLSATGQLGLVKVMFTLTFLESSMIIS